MVSLEGYNIKVGASNFVEFNIRIMKKVARWRQLLNAQVGGKKCPKGNQIQWHCHEKWKKIITPKHGIHD